MASYLLTSLLLISFGYLATAIPIENGLVGDPEVECLSDRVKMVFTTDNEFTGHVYAKGFYLEDSCNNPAAGGSGADVEYQFDTCGVSRRRSLEPKGVYVTGVIVIQFHPFVLTKVDRAIRFQCFYMEADKTVDTDLEVSMITTEFQTFQVPMPVCRYEIFDQNGEIVKYALIGDKVTHKWTCDTDTQDIFCMEVYGCHVNNVAISDLSEDLNALELMTQDGCAVDGNLLQNAIYDDSENDGARGLMAEQETHVFKYADRPALYFNCQIRIGVRDPGTTCQDYREATGGPCNDAPLLRRRRSAENKTVKNMHKKEGGRDLGDVDVVPDALYVLDIENSQQGLPSQLRHDPIRRLSPAHTTSTTSVQQGFCVSSTFFGVVVFLALIFLIASIVLGVILCLRQPSKQ